MSELLGEITLTPVLKMWRPRVNRDHPVTGRLVQAIGRWHDKRMDGKAYSKPSIETDYDTARRCNEFTVSWEEADLPPGREHQRFVIPPPEHLTLNNASWWRTKDE